MAPAFELIRGPYYADLLEQPRSLRATVDGLSGQALSPALVRSVRESGKPVLLTGMGASLFALYPLHLAMVEAGVCSILVETAELLHAQAGWLAQAEVIVAVSQSGASAEIVRLIGSSRPGGRLVGVTNTPDGPLARAATDRVLTRAGVEATVSCKTYLATLAALAWITAGLVSGADGPARVLSEISRVAAEVEEYLAGLPGTVMDLAARLDGVRGTLVAGRGSSLAAALTGALINKEAAGVPVEGSSSAALRHGPFEMAGPSTLMLVMEGAPPVASLNRRLVEDLLRAGGRAALIGEHSAIPGFRHSSATESTRPILEILPMQALSLAWAAREGREAGRFTKATKVTAME